MPNPNDPRPSRRATWAELPQKHRDRNKYTGADLRRRREANGVGPVRKLKSKIMFAKR